MRKYYEFAGVQIQVTVPDDVEFSRENALEPFACDGVADPYCFSFSLVQQLSPPMGRCVAAEPALRVYGFSGGTLRYIGAVANSWEEAYIRVERRGKLHEVQLKASAYTAGIGGKTVLSSIAAEHLVARSGGFVFHSSFIEYRGKGILFTAPSGTGKSTQADLWHTYRGAEIINGDRSAVRVTDGGITACGIPFAGSSCYCKNRTLPLAAVVCLKQGRENRIRRLVGAEAFCRIWGGCSANTWDTDDVAAVSGAVEQVVAGVPIYELSCTPEEEAVRMLEETLMREAIL